MPETTKYARNDVRVLSNDEVAPEHFLITLADHEMASTAHAGHFFQVRLTGSDAPYLPRPFSIYDWHEDDSGRRTAVKLLYKVVGKGTSALSRLKAGDTVAVTGPLGNTFTLPTPDKIALVAAGGIGIASFLSLLKEALAAGYPAKQFHLLYGARCQSLLVEHERFAELGASVEVITDDGSCGIRGNVLDLVRKRARGLSKEAFTVYASGPTPMLDAVGRYCQEHGINGELTLEARMICGFGACNSCAVAVKSPKAPDGWEYKLVCRDGPVFSAESLCL